MLTMDVCTAVCKFHEYCDPLSFKEPQCSGKHKCDICKYMGNGCDPPLNLPCEAYKIRADIPPRLKMSSDDYVFSAPFARDYIQEIIDNIKKEKKIMSDEKGNKFPGYRYIPINCRVKRIVYNDPATIVFWNDGSKTVVKCMDGEPFNPYYGFLAALAKQVYGTNSEVNRIVKSGHMQKEPETKPKEKKNKVKARSNKK